MQEEGIKVREENIARLYPHVDLQWWNCYIVSCAEIGALAGLCVLYL